MYAKIYFIIISLWKSSEKNPYDFFDDFPSAASSFFQALGLDVSFATCTRKTFVVDAPDMPEPWPGENIA